MIALFSAICGGFWGWFLAYLAYEVLRVYEPAPYKYIVCIVVGAVIAAIMIPLGVSSDMSKAGYVQDESGKWIKYN
jgi:hypothetical protein